MVGRKGLVEDNMDIPLVKKYFLLVNNFYDHNLKLIFFFSAFQSTLTGGSPFLFLK
jgi:hypothetical protein